MPATSTNTKPTITSCANCGVDGKLEAAIVIELEAIKIRDGKVVAFITNGTADNPYNGIVAHPDGDGVYLQCAECGHPVDAEFPIELTDCWQFTEPTGTP